MKEMKEKAGIGTVPMHLVRLSCAGAVTRSNDFADLVNDRELHLALVDFLIALAGLS